MQCRSAALSGGRFLVSEPLPKVPEKVPFDTRFLQRPAGLQKGPSDGQLLAPMKPTILPLLVLSATLAMSNTAKAELKVGDSAPGDHRRRGHRPVDQLRRCLFQAGLHAGLLLSQGRHAGVHGPGLLTAGRLREPYQQGGCGDRRQPRQRRGPEGVQGQVPPSPSR